MFTTEQFASTQKRYVETFLGVSQKALDNVEKVVALNLQTTKAVLDDARGAVLSAKDPQSLFVPAADVLSPVADKASAYGREVYEIAAQASAELSKIAEDSAAQTRQQMLEFIDSAVKNAPAGSENFANMFKTGVLSANEAFDGVQRLAKQAGESVEANLGAFVAKTAKTDKPASTKGKRA
ncbi:MAG: TIGR01841 family phasin [Burkholderiaceae bacterium]